MVATTGRMNIQAGALPLDTDLLNIQRFVQSALGQVIAGTLGTGTTLVDGFTCIPTTPATLSVQVTPGSVFALEEIDQTAFGSLSADTTQIMKVGTLAATQTFAITAPSTTGYSQCYLIESAFSEADGIPVVLSFFNSGTPSSPLNGPGGSGLPTETQRICSAVLTLKAGIASLTGTQTPPTPDAGNVGLFVVTIANGALALSSSNIAAYSGAPFVPIKLPSVPAAIQAQAANYAVDTGTANAIAITLPAYTSVSTGLTLRVEKGLATTGAATLAVNGGAANAVQWSDGSALGAGDWPANAIGEVTFNGSTWNLSTATGPTVFVRNSQETVNFYVNGALGNDSNSGLANVSGSAFATIAGAVASISARYVGLYQANIYVANGSYGGASFYGGGVTQWNVIGNTTTPSAVAINSSSITVNNGRGFTAYAGAIVTVGGFSVSSYIENFAAFGGGVLNVYDIISSPPTGTPIGAIAARDCGFLFLYGNIQYSGSYGISLLIAETNGILRVGYNDPATGATASFSASGTTSMSWGFALGNTGGQVSFAASMCSFSGTVTGPRYDATNYGIVNTFGGGASFLPGSTAGTATTGLYL